MKKRIIFFESYYRSFYGAQQNLLRLIRFLDRSRFEPLIIMPGDGPLRIAAEKYGIPVKIIPYPQALDVFGGKLTSSMFYQLSACFHLVRYSLQLYKSLKNEQVDIICCNQRRSLLTIGFMAKLCRIPLIWYLRTDIPKRFLDDIGLFLADKIVCVSEGVEKIFTDRQKRHYSRKFVVIHNGVELDRFSGEIESFRKSTSIPEKDFVIGMVSAIRPLKGHRFFIEAARRMLREYSHVHFVIVGGPNNNEESSYLNQLKDQVQQLGIGNRVHFLGFRTDIPSIMKGLDLLVLPSFAEGLPNVILEAMASGKAVIASRVGGVEQVVVDHETGLLVLPRDTEALYKAMLELIKRPAKVKVMGIKGKERVEKYFSMSGCVRKFEDVLTTI
ncbi:MAG: hypothetical protein A3G93_07875 [Nitrospinae bacterium RIFCSPLOWO2_12_FULL_45_22]|nr:MAG: hypothetical protein A3G93_07875 [Nitrospinae bacterium RIFCSPLOWO2_12_FULL_45_22]